MLRFMTAGNVDDGKSTLIGRLLYEAKGVYEDQLDSIRKMASPAAPGLDLALITDGLKAEREQAITIDVAYRYFFTTKRKFILADAPGHEQYTRNMVTAASTADLAILVVDIRKGPQKQTRRHAYLIWLLGIRRLVIAINKMDLVEFSEQAFMEVAQQFRKLMDFLPGMETHFVPVSALDGDNVVHRSPRLSWYGGSPLLELLETVPIEDDRNLKDTRYLVQSIIRPNQDFRGYAGQVVSGIVRVGQEVMALPSRRMTKIKSIQLHTRTLEQAAPPQSIVLSLSDEIDLGRGDMLVDPERTPLTANCLIADVVWMSEAPLRVGSPYLIKHANRTLCCSFLNILHRIDTSSFQEIPCQQLCLNEIGAVEIQTHKPVFFDTYASNRGTGSFIIIDPNDNATAGAGIISQPSSVSNGWVPSGRLASLSPNSIGQHPRGLTVWLTGLSGAGKTTIAGALCTELLARGFRVELLDGDVVRQLFGNDLGFSEEDRNENIRRIGFLAEMLTRNGAVVLVSAISPYRAAREDVRCRIGDFIEVYVNAPLNVCEQRDPKGLYRKARIGKITAFTGLDSPYEEPLAPEVECNTERESLRACTEKLTKAVLSFLATTSPTRVPPQIYRTNVNGNAPADEGNYTERDGSSLFLG